MQNPAIHRTRYKILYQVMCLQSDKRRPSRSPLITLPPRAPKAGQARRTYRDESCLTSPCPNNRRSTKEYQAIIRLHLLAQLECLEVCQMVRSAEGLCHCPSTYYYVPPARLPAVCICGFACSISPSATFFSKAYQAGLDYHKTCVQI